MNKKFKYGFEILICILLSIVSSYLLVLSPKYIGDAVDLMIGVNQVELQVVLKILSLAMLLYIIYFISTWIISYLSNSIALTIVHDFRNKLEHTINRNPLSYIDTTAHGSLLNLFTLDSEILIDGIYQFLSQLFSGIFVVIIVFYFMLQVSIYMTITTVVMLPLMYLSSRYFAKKSTSLYKIQQRLSADLSAYVSETLNNHELIMSSNYEKQALRDFEEIHNEYNIVGEKTQILGALVNPTVRVINSLAYALIGLIGAILVLDGSISVGMFTSFISYTVIFFKPFNEFSAIIAQITAAKASYDRIESALRVAIESEVENTEKLIGDIVEFNSVDFSYVSGKPIIKDFSLKIPPLSKVAIVGPTGAGKSTLINILMRFYDVQSGEIKVDNINTKNIKRHNLREVMSIVLQEPWLFEGSILDNIKYGKPDATYDEVVKAAKDAGCHDYIMSLDNAYDTLITHGSTNISLGQKQMITIARAIIVDSPIIILDEATSNIDVLSEYKIQEVFRYIMSNKTSFFIAHRLATVVDSDVILVMNEGVLVESGNHQELMNKKGFYHELFTSQYDN